MSQVSIAHEFANQEGQAVDGELIDFRAGQARRVLRNAISRLQDLLVQLNARPGHGINVGLIEQIVRAEKAVARAQTSLISVDPNDEFARAVEKALAPFVAPRRRT